MYTNLQLIYTKIRLVTITNIFYVGCDSTYTNDFIFDIPQCH